MGQSHQLSEIELGNAMSCRYQNNETLRLETVQFNITFKRNRKLLSKIYRIKNPLTNIHSSSRFAF